MKAESLEHTVQPVGSSTGWTVLSKRLNCSNPPPDNLAGFYFSQGAGLISASSLQLGLSESGSQKSLLLTLGKKGPLGLPGGSYAHHLNSGTQLAIAATE